MRLKLLPAIGLLIFLTGCAQSAKIGQLAEPNVKAVVTGETAKPIQFKKIIAKINRGALIGAIEGGLLCIPQGQLTWRGGRIEISDQEWTEIFRDELTKANYSLVGDPNALFDDPDNWRAEILVAGAVTDMKANLCFPMAGFGDWNSGKGEASLKVEWQIYSRLDRKVIYTVTTEGAGKAELSTANGTRDVVYNAFSQATRALLADAKFHDLVTQGPTGLSTDKSAAEVPSTNFPPLTITGSNKKRKVTVAEAAKSVVTIFAGDGHGSGFVISEDGYVLTNSHVVEGAKFIKAKIADGKEILGEVVRSDRRRDVALVKLSNAKLVPLAVRMDRPEIGSEVFAIGSPFLPALEGTLTRGIISGYRSDSGYDLIQSDATVAPGSSGGPLVDNQGAVVAITVSGITRRGAETGINFFIPIADALAKLGVNLGAPT
jgi:S1-C subfamily serine protease